MKATCKVSRVKPQADIYWRKGTGGTLDTGTTTSVANGDGTFQLQSIYSVSFSRSDTHLYCLVTRPGDRTDVWSTTSSNVDVICEYFLVIGI